MPQPIRDEQIRFITASLLVLAAVAIAFALYFTRGFMVPFVLAIFVSTMVSPVVDHLVRRRVPHGLAIAAALVLVLLLLGVMVYVTVFAIQAIISTAEEYSENFTEMSDRLFQWLKELDVDIEQADVTAGLRDVLISSAPQTASVGLSIVSNGMAILIFVVFLLAGRPGPRPSSAIYTEIEARIRNYVVTKFFLSVATGVLVAALLSLLGLRMAFVFGILAFFLNFIPSVGSVIATLLPLPIAVAQFQSPMMWLWVLLLPGAVQMGIGNGLEPKLMGEGMKLHPVVVLLALALWGLLWGIAGMVLSVPLTASIRIVLMEFETTRPVGNLLAGELPRFGDEGSDRAADDRSATPR